VPIRTRPAPLASRDTLGAPVAGSDTLAASTWGPTRVVTDVARVTDAAATAVLSSSPGDEPVLVVVDGAVVVVVDAAVVLVVVVDAALELVVVSAAVVVGAATVVVAVDATVVGVVVVTPHSGLITVTSRETTSFGVIELHRATTTSVADPVESSNVDVPVADAPGATLLGLSDIADPLTFAESKVIVSPGPVSLLPTVHWTVHPPVSIQLGCPLTTGCQAEATPADSAIEAPMAPIATATNSRKRFTEDPFGHKHARCVAAIPATRKGPARISVLVAL
jgi:hypothetical protein